MKCQSGLLLLTTVGMDVVKVLLERSLLRSGGSFRFPLFTVLMHQLVAFAILSCTGSVLRLWTPGPPWRSDGSHAASPRALAAEEARTGAVTPLFKLPPPRQSYSVAGFVLLVALYGANTSLDELALAHIDGSTLKALRASKPLVVSLIGGAICGGELFHGRAAAVPRLRRVLLRALRLGAMSGVALGAALLYCGSAESDAVGVALAAAATLASALHLMVTAFMLRRDGSRFFLSPPTLLLWLSMTWAAVLFPAVWIREGFARPLAAANRGGGATWSKLGGSAVVGGAKALLELVVIEHFGAAYAATLAVFKVPLMVGAEAVFGGRSLSPVEFAGTLAVVVSFAVYHWAHAAERQRLRLQRGSGSSGDGSGASALGDAQVAGRGAGVYSDSDAGGAVAVYAPV